VQLALASAGVFEEEEKEEEEEEEETKKGRGGGRDEGLGAQVWGQPQSGESREARRLYLEIAALKSENNAVRRYLGKALVVEPARTKGSDPAMLWDGFGVELKLI
jgi:hypothetical protein